jgi:MarR family transcriptional regulator, organic hydroperoxide resistance regulator
VWLNPTPRRCDRPILDASSFPLVPWPFMGREASQLQHELKQRRPFRSPAHEATIGLLRTADVVRQRLTEVLAPTGLTLQQYNVLRILRGAGGEGLPTLEIAARMIEHAPGITRLLDRLEAKGLVRRVRCPEDRRQVLCWPTENALAVLAGFDRSVERAERDVVGGMRNQDLLALIPLLDRIRQGPESSSP